MNNNNNIDIEYNGIIYTIIKENTESFEIFYKRAWYIVKKQPCNIESFENATILSKIWRNNKYLDMKYNDDILNLL